MSKRFKKQEHHRYVRVGSDDSWRKPRGHHSKMREHRKGNPRVVDSGFGNEASERFKHPTGLFEVVVSTEKELGAIDKKDSGARLSGTLSKKRKFELTEAAKKLGIKVFNPAKAPKPKQKKAKPEAKPEAKAAAKSKATKEGEVSK